MPKIYVTENQLQKKIEALLELEVPNFSVTRISATELPNYDPQSIYLNNNYKIEFRERIV